MGKDLRHAKSTLLGRLPTWRLCDIGEPLGPSQSAALEGIAAHKAIHLEFLSTCPVYLRPDPTPHKAIRKHPATHRYPIPVLHSMPWPTKTPPPAEKELWEALVNQANTADRPDPSTAPMPVAKPAAQDGHVFAATLPLSAFRIVASKHPNERPMNRLHSRRPCETAFPSYSQSLRRQTLLPPSRCALVLPANSNRNRMSTSFDQAPR